MSSMDHYTPINTLRFLAVDAVEKAKSGHPGLPMGAAATAYTLWTKSLKFDPAAPQWPDRDRFVLSAGHGSMLIYGLLHLSGYDVSIDDLKNFRQWGSSTAGHPEYGHIPGVETTTGPLGQGIAAAVGMAMAERHLATTFNKPGLELVDHYTWVLSGDGCLMEGVSAEAASMAGHLGLGRLIVLWDDNRITIEGSTDLAFTEDVEKRFESYGWDVSAVEDGNDVDALARAMENAKAVTDKPTLIRVRTHIGFGSPAKQDSSSAHGSPLGEAEVIASKENLGWPSDKTFYVPEGARDPFTANAAEGSKSRAAWEELLAKYRQSHPEDAAQWDRLMLGELPAGFEDALPVYETDAKGIASRVASGKAINALAPVLPELFGGSADLAPSNNTHINGEEDFEAANYGGRNVRFGVREHAMGAIANGIANHGGLIPFVATFFVFTDYMRPAIRLSALMGVRTIHVMTHDSFYLGEDGPTHQPVEHLSSLRSMPGLSIIRPADANETSEAWKLAVENKNGPTILVLSRQNLPTLDREKLGRADVSKGGYILKDAEGGPVKAILIASGSEVHLALAAAAKLEDMGTPTRVVNLASWDLFESQPAEYRDKVLPPEVTARVALEAGATLGWERYTGFKGKILGLDRFGASAPGDVLAEKFGFTVDNVVALAGQTLKS
jgi:transketolase